MNISILTDNYPGNYTQAEHGLSYLIEDDVKILFDTGQSDLFLRNAEKLNINLDTVDTVILSHGHYDHGNGLKYLRNKRLICHPEAFISRYRKADEKRTNIGISINEKQVRSLFHLTTVETPLLISNHIFFLGEIPRLNDFEAKTTSFIKEDNSDDFVMDDSAIAVRMIQGLIIVSGCGHAGICNIIEYAKKITREKKVYGVIGGFHLKESDSITRKVIEYFKSENIKRIYPAHCTALPAMAAFWNEFGIQQVKTGDVLNFNMHDNIFYT